MAAQIQKGFNCLNTELLALMADGEVHSGQELAELLGISRTAVWKQLRKLEELGLEIESLKARGYRLAHPIQLLNHSDVAMDLKQSTRALLSRLDFHGSVGSTNSLAMELAQQGDGHGAVVVAEHQSGGRGRRGRSWVSPYAANLYVSFVWEFNGGAAALEGLSLAVGVAMVEGLESIGVTGCRLKWPNDLLVDGKKMGGILLEMTGDVSGQCAVVIGVGLNVQMPGNAARDIDQDWTDAVTVSGSTDLNRNEILAALLNSLLPAMETFAQGGFSAFHTRWSVLDAHAGESVDLFLGENRVTGIARGVDEQGALKLETDEGIKVFHGGEVSLRGST